VAEEEEKEGQRSQVSDTSDMYGAVANISASCRLRMLLPV
jgi:hypothetical protein